MKENGRFRPKKSFTMTPNEVARSNELSQRAKGLYVHIMSYITCDTFSLTKSFLLRESVEGEKAFDRSWQELKQMGYLKVYFLKASKGRWVTEYELLDQASAPGTPHTYYCDANGKILSTNLDRKTKKELSLSEIPKQDSIDKSETENNEVKGEAEKEVQINEVNRYPKMGDTAKMTEKADRYPHLGVTVKTTKESYRYPQNGSNGKGGNNSNTNNNTNIKKEFNSFQFNSTENEFESKRTEDIDVIKKTVQEELYSQLKLPYYRGKPEKMKIAIQLLTEMDSNLTNTRTGHAAAYATLNDALVHMCSSNELRLKGESISYTQIIDKINRLLAQQGSLPNYGFLVFQSFCEYIIAKFLTAVETRNITDYNKYMQSMIWEGLSKYEIDFHKSIVEEGLLL